MIVILRRIKAAACRVTGTEWLLVLVEGLLVFLGIFAAFQLDQWAEDRREAKQVERLMERLFVEAQGAVGHYDFYSRQENAILAEAQANALLFARGECPADFTTIEQVNRRVVDPPRSAALTELVEVVGLSAIPDDDLKNQLSAYHYGNTKFYSELDRLQRETVPLFDEGDLRRRLKLDAEIAAADNSLSSNLVDMPTLTFAVYDRERLCADNDFKQRYIASTTQLLELNAMRLDMLIVSMRVCRQIGRMIGRECFDERLRPLLGEDRINALDAHVRQLMDLRDRQLNGARP